MHHCPHFNRICVASIEFVRPEMIDVIRSLLNAKVARFVKDIFCTV